jgi:hypothetical protein
VVPHLGQGAPGGQVPRHQLAFVVDELYAPKTEPIFAKNTGEVVGDKRISPPVTALLAEIRQSEAKLGATL